MSDWCTLASARRLLGSQKALLQDWMESGLVAQRHTDGVTLVSMDDLFNCQDTLTADSFADSGEAPPEVLAAFIDQRLVRANHLAQVGTLAMSVGHEINNPLTYVVGNNEYIRNDLLPALKEITEGSEQGRQLLDELHELCSEVDQGAQHIGEVVEQLRGLARRESKPAPVMLANAVRAALRMSSPSWSGAVSIENDLPDARRVLVSEVQLTQVLMNLFTNAAHALQGAEKPEIRVVLREEADRALVEVHDNGAGIPEALVPRVFDPFFTTKPLGEGTGFGLAVCKQLVKEMGGELTLLTEYGQGTTVRLSVPLHTSESVSAETPQPAASNLSGRSILVIDDEQPVLLSMQRMLAGFGMKVECLSDPATAVERILATDVELILCDLMMPGMTGMAIYREVLARRPDIAVRFTFVSGGPSSEEARAFAHAHADRMIAKPLVRQEVHNQLFKALQSPRAYSEPCPNISRCPMFGLFQTDQMLSIYKTIYCEPADESFKGCERYRSMKAGVMPAATLLPTGESLS